MLLSSDGALDACVGTSRTVTIISDDRTGADGRPPVGGAATLVDHPGCQRRFTIAPGVDFGWTESIKIPPVAFGPATLSLGVQIVYPRSCHVFGCADMMTHASTRTVTRWVLP
jgi:hypothetical protein